MVVGNFVSYLADLSDPTLSTREIDLNGYEVGNGPFETDTDTLDLGAPDLDGVWLSEAGKDEDVLSAHRRGRVVASFNLRLVSTSRVTTLDEATTYLRALNRALDRFGVWVLHQPGASEPLYIDHYPSPLAQQLAPGQRSMTFLWTQLQSPTGLPIKIIRRPKMRGAILDAETNLAHNGTMAEEDPDAANRPLFWEWSSETGMSDFGYDWTYGAHEAQMPGSDATRFFFQTVDDGVVVEDDVYSLGIDVASTYSVRPGVRAAIEWLDDVGAQIGSRVVGELITVLSPPGSADQPGLAGFARPVIEGAIAPADAVSARYGLQVVSLGTGNVHMWVRNAQFETGDEAHAFRAGPETISNDSTQPFGKRIWGYNSANADALAQFRISPDDEARIAEVTYSRRSGPRESAEAMRILPGWRGVDSTALMNGTTSVSDSDASGGNTAKTNLDDDVMRSVLRQEVPQTDESALRGTWRLLAAIRGDLQDVYQFEGRYGYGDVADLPIPMVRRRLNLNAPPDASDYYIVDLGPFRVPANTPGWFFELQAMRETTDDGDGDGELYIDQLWPEPIDDLTGKAGLRSIAFPGGQMDDLLGADMVTPPDGLADDPGTSNPFVAGSVYGTAMLLNDIWEAVGLPLGLTDSLSPGEHTYIVDTLLFTQNEDRPYNHGDFRVHDLTTDTQVAVTPINNTRGMRWEEKSFPIKFTAIAAHEYLVYVVQTDVPEDVGNIRVEAIHHSFTPPVDGAAFQTIAVDADQRRAYILDEDNQFMDNLILTPPFPTLEPKLQLYRVSLATLPSNGSGDVLDDGPALKHEQERTAVVGINVLPRFYN